MSLYNDKCEVFILFRQFFLLLQGLYPESHGIIDNRFYDAKIGKPFYSNNRDSVKDSRFWDAAEPVIAIILLCI